MPMPRIAITEDTAEEALRRCGVVPEAKGNLSGIDIHSHNGHSYGSFDLADWLARHNVPIKSSGEYQGGMRYILDCCPFDSSHVAKDAAIFQSAAGKIGFRCQHNSCANYHWQDVRRLYEPGAYEQRNDTSRASRRNDAPAAIDPATMSRAPSLREIVNTFPELRPPLIHGLLRRGETMNIIAPPKMGKSWLVTALAVQATVGGRWLDTFSIMPSNVLILDNELHAETSASRIPKVAAGLNLFGDGYLDSLFVKNLRGKSLDVFSLGRYLDQYKPGDLGLVVIDAFYRALPAGTDENANGDMTAVYNTIDEYAARLNCSFVLIHHASKGNQAGKVVTDIGSGAGAQSRATDTHLVLRPHIEPNAVVLDAAVRSWAPVEPICLRWEWPCWKLAPELDPAQLHTGKPERKAATPAQALDNPSKFEKACEDAWRLLLKTGPTTKSQWKAKAGMSGERINTAIEVLIERGQIESCEVKTAKGTFDGYRALEGKSDTSDTSDSPGCPT